MTHSLPVEKLGPADFERLCLWLVRREGYQQAEALGEAGSEQGRDIVAWKDGRHVAFQCKRVRQFGPKDALAEIEKIRKLPVSEQPEDLIFQVTSPVSTKTRQKAREAWGEAGTCSFWAGSELDEKIKSHSEILAEFFDLSRRRHWLLVAGAAMAVAISLVVLLLLKADRERRKEKSSEAAAAAIRDENWALEVLARPANDLTDELLRRSFSIAREQEIWPIELLWDGDQTTGLNIVEARVKDWAIDASVVGELNLRDVRAEWLRIKNSNIKKLRFLDVYIQPRLLYVTEASKVEFYPTFSSFSLRIDKGAHVDMNLSASNKADLLVEEANISGSRINCKAIASEATFSRVDLTGVSFVDCEGESLNKLDFFESWASALPRGLPVGIRGIEVRRENGEPVTTSGSLDQKQ